MTKIATGSAKSTKAARRARAVESFCSAAEAIGELEKSGAIFGITRGQFSMIDLILACLDQSGPAEISIWTWTVADYEVECLEALQRDGRVTAGTLIIDHGARQKNTDIIQRWQSVFGASSVRYVVNHAKLATIENAGWRLLLRGSMNLNCNPRFEQFDLTEGGGDFDLVKQIERELPILQNDCSGPESYVASGLSRAWADEQLRPFAAKRVWAK